MKKLSAKHPVIFSIIVAALFILVLVAASFISSLPNFSDAYEGNLLNEVILATYAIVMLVVSGHTYVLKKANGKNFGKGLISGLYFIIIGIFMLFIGALGVLGPQMSEDIKKIIDASGLGGTEYILKPTFYIICFILFMILVGVAEEFTFRGVIAETLASSMATSVWRTRLAIVLSGVLFGSVHLINAFMTNPMSALVQAFLVSFMGMAFVVIYLKNQNIWAIIFIHAFNDFAILAFDGGGFFYEAGAETIDTMTEGMTYGAINFLGVLPYLIILPIMLRKSNMLKIIENYNPDALKEIKDKEAGEDFKDED